MMEPCWLEIQDVCAIHGEIIAESGGTPGILNEGALESTLNKPRNLYHYGDDVTLYQLAASYGYGLVKNRCFVDGNKRVALIAVYTFLSIHGIELIASEVDAASFFLELAASLESQEASMEKLVCWLQDNSESQSN
ncbi:type II toxin-antitoxin system death-on-curing family toxin [Merismopedia glauca]|uniref:Type II toxin-antitoxin system death-on-curing family toxin n=1 Tax=Merismopedia glauca CCAP 1448/3 TaxID=1296344 RepID=A0A2T1C143_9CYAN|nr:type II toxin-antitoxin system death-on-curing family toxin [Merismopedia glauca]PSB01995.1 type II toxin-antitoxin system death-on-curing family toxin [Merismopedia glauca CCAP 1448/3]